MFTNPFSLIANVFFSSNFKVKLRNRGYVCFGHAMRWAVGHWCHLVEAQVKSQGRQCGICGGQIVYWDRVVFKYFIFLWSFSSAPYAHNYSFFISAPYIHKHSSFISAI